jgi:hypothetical protein
MCTNYPPPDQKSLKSLILPVLLVFVIHASGQTTDSFSLDIAKRIYGDTTTATALTKYLEAASAEQKNDFRYKVYQIKGYYATYRFEEGDALIEKALGAAKDAGVSDGDVQGMQTDLKTEKTFWENQYSESISLAKETPKRWALGSGGGPLHSGGVSIQSQKERNASGY